VPADGIGLTGGEGVRFWLPIGTILFVDFAIEIKL
jgi:hypothetical protein